MSRLILTAVLALALGGAADAKQCRDASGKFVKCPPPAAATTTANPATNTAAKPHCTKGVPCGNTCISKGKACHKS